MQKYKSYKYRIYPSKNQEQLIQRTFGCCRFVYNQILALQNSRYADSLPYMSWMNANKHCNNVLKRDYPFLREVDKFALTNSIRSLDRAFRSFFDKNTNYPRFKTKHRSKKSYTTNFSNGNIALMENGIKLPKLKVVKAKIHRLPPNDSILKSATISQNSIGEYYCSLLFEFDVLTPTKDLDTAKAVGLDFKIDGLYVDSNGSICGSPRFYSKSCERLAFEQRKLSKKRPGSKNYLKQKKKVAKISQHVLNQRKDFLHKETHLLSEKWDIVCVENIDLKSMASKNQRMGKAVMDNGYGLFLHYLQYKMEDRNKALIKVDRYYPSSQICSCCQNRNVEVKTKMMRRWECPICGAKLDRDINAAINIKYEGVRLYNDNKPVEV